MYTCKDCKCTEEVETSHVVRVKRKPSVKQEINRDVALQTGHKQGCTCFECESKRENFFDSLEN